MIDLTERIDQLLAERRPDRYEPNGDDAWLDDIADEVAHLIPEAEARVRYALAEVRRREGQQAKSANRLLREIHSTGAAPLDWMDLANLPIVVGKERIALRVVQPFELRDFAGDERRRASGDFAARNETCVAAEWIADQMDAHGVTVARDLALALPDPAAPPP